MQVYINACVRYVCGASMYVLICVQVHVFVLVLMCDCTRVCFYNRICAYGSLCIYVHVYLCKYVGCKYMFVYEFLGKDLCFMSSCDYMRG